MGYDANNMNSYDAYKGTPQRAHEGSQSHNGTDGCPVSDPGGYTAGLVGEGTPTKNEKGAPSGMEM